VSAALALFLLASCSGGDGDGESSAGSSATEQLTTPVAPGTTQAATTTAAPTTIATTTTAPPSAVDAPCPPGTTPQARCGTVTVPLDRANPDAGTIDIYFAFVPRPDAGQPTAGTVLGLAGGPGPASLLSGPGAWVDWARSGGNYDLLLTDYRGTGRSGALHCSTQDEGFPTEIQAARSAIAACGEELGDQAPYFDTVATADDLEAVRTALGLGPLDLLGISHGSYVAQVFAARYPDSVRSVTLDGAGPLDQGDDASGFALYSIPNLHAALAALGTVCARSGGACTPEQVAADLRAVVEQVRAAPSPGLPDAAMVGRTLLDSANLPALPAALRAAAQGDRSRLEAMAGPLQPQPTGGGPIGAAEEFSAALSSSVSCNDFPGEFESADRAAREEQVATELGALPADVLAPFTAEEWVTIVDGANGIRSLCVGWPVPESASGDEQAEPLPDVPVLIMNGDLDLLTPTSGAEQTVAGWPGAVLVRFPNVGHTPMLQTPCALTVLGEFLQTQSVADSEVCATAVPPPAPAA
jgi:pimeloyl-ACP methyl ester carboxylesterase